MSRPVLVSIKLETSATRDQLRRFYWATICDGLTRGGHYARIARVTVTPIKEAKG